MSVDKKETIINAAIRLFAERSFEGTSIRDIAAHADVNIAMINYYFGSKEKLFEQLVEFKANYTRDALSEIVNDISLSPIQKLDKVIDMYVNKLFSNRLFHRVIHQELMLSQREVLQQAIVNMMAPNYKLLRGIIETGIKEGSFRKVDAVLTISTLIGTINQLLLSKPMCVKLLDKDSTYVPYDDEKFKKRVIDHLKQVTHAHLLVRDSEQ